MFKPFTTEDSLSVSNSEPIAQLKPSRYSWKTLTKAGLVFVMTTATFCALKATGSFSLISSWLKNRETDFDEQETKLAVHDEAKGVEAYSEYPDFKESPLAAVKDSHEHVTFMPQRAKRNPVGIPEKIGPEFHVNTYTDGAQERPSVTGLNDGKFVVTWASGGGGFYDQDGSGYGVFGQVFKEDGSKYFTEFQVNTCTSGHQQEPSVAGLSNGEFIVVWESSGMTCFNDVYGWLISEFIINTYRPDIQRSPKVAKLNSGKFVVVWESCGQDGSDDGVYGQLFSEGSMYGSEFQVNTYTVGHQRDPSVAGLIDGKLVVTWVSNGQDGDSWGIFGQLFYANSTKYNTEFQVNTYTTSEQWHTSVAGLDDGKFVATWHSLSQDGDNYGIYGQLFNANGTKYASEFQVNTYTTNSQFYPSVTGLDGGKFVVVWHSGGQDGNSLGVYGQIFEKDGTKYASEFQVNTYTAGDQQEPSVAKLNDGKFVVTWWGSGQNGETYGVYGQMFSTNETFASSQGTSLTSQSKKESLSSILVTSDQSQKLSRSETGGIISIGTIIGIIIGGTSLVLCIVGGTVGYFLYRKNRKVESKEIDLEEENISVPKEESMKKQMSMLADDGSVKTSLIIPYKKLKLGQKIGGGGSGIVYKGRWQHTDVAIKQLHSIEFDPHAKIEFNREVSIMAALRHTNIVSLFGICFEPEFCIVMEYMEGGSLYSLLHSNEELPWSSRLHMAMDITRGLAYLHEKDIVHRDLKSLNVLLTKDRQAKLTDFGLSKEKTGMAGTMTKGLIGTARWIAPELMDVEKYELEGYTKKADIYSYGMILYELSSRLVPFQEDDNEMIVMKKVEQGSRPKIPEDCPEVYGILLSHCWRQRSETRPDINGAMEALKACREELPAEETAKCSTNRV